MNTIIEQLQQYVRAANYLSAAQIYLRDNFLLERPLSFDDIKPRLLGHWGTCPGINFIYAHLNYWVKTYHVPMLFIQGPGHGFPALQANLFLEGTLKTYYPQATHDKNGLKYLIKNFCWPYGFPSHSNPGAPGVILEGGELGYALSTAYGAALDNPDTIVACVVGDGEAETGATATAWHLNKLVDPVTNGVVLPILHLNGYKISGPTLFGRMTNKALKSLFSGYGYEPFIVEGPDIDEKMLTTLETCYTHIQALKSGNSRLRPPMIILKTPKGWTGLKTLHGLKMEGNCLSHQVMVTEAKSDSQELQALEKWLKSYDFPALFNDKTGFIDAIYNVLPEKALCMGANKHTYGGDIVKPLILPDINELAENASIPGTIGSSSMRFAGNYLHHIFEFNQSHHNFRLFSPDETYSNKLDKVFQNTTRANLLPIKSWDKDISSVGRVMEMLSEHSLQGLMQGYVLTGRHAIFASYEAFLPIISSMVDQYMKFLHVAREFPWRGDIPSLNYILTSSGWRQEHNGFSHQNPSFISNLLQKNGHLARAYFPPDANSTLAVLEKCLTSRNVVNVIVAGKTLEARWLTPALAQRELEQGLMTWDFASDADPDIVFVGIGDYVSTEMLAAITLVKQETPEIKIRFVNVIELSADGLGDVDAYFTEDKPVMINFHGYPSVIQQLLFHHGNTQRFFIHGYVENGSTTTPYDMHIRNKTSRWHLVQEVFSLMAQRGVIAEETAVGLQKKYDQKFIDHRHYIQQYGVDPDEITGWKWV